jgi:hypothetical protein
MMYAKLSRSVIGSLLVFLGLADYSPTPSTTPFINMYELAKQPFVNGETNINKMTDNFGNNAVSWLNMMPPELRRPPPLAIPLVSVGIYGGIGDNDTPMLSYVSVSYNETLNSYGHVPPRDHKKFGKVVTLNYFDVTRDIIAGADFQAIRTMERIPAKERYAGMIELLVRQVIERKVSVEVGGNPTVLVIEKNKHPRWHRKAKDCPELK